MKNGLRIWDTDTHIHPTNEVLDPYFDSSFRARLPELQHYVRPAGAESGTLTNTKGGHVYSVAKVAYRRFLGEAAPREMRVGNFANFQGTTRPSQGAASDNVEGRIHDMDVEGVDVQLLVPTPPVGVQLMKDPQIEIGFMRAYNRYMSDFCGKYPDRLKALMVVTGSAIDESVREIKAWGKSRWAVGIRPYTAIDQPLDHPELEPIWAAAEEEGLAVVYHSMTWDYPYFPGYRDLDDNAFLSRLSSHPWGAMKFVASFIGAGILDRYPNIRFGILECGCGWLPFWTRRMESQLGYVGTTAPLKHKISEYMTDGRFFSSLEMHEGEDMIKMVMDFLGEGVLMYASDYPHNECMFPESTNNAVGWKGVNRETLQKLMWDNPVRFYGQP